MDMGGVPLKLYLSLQCGFKHWNYVFTFHSVNIKALCPALQDPMVNVVLGRRVGEGESQRVFRKLLSFVMVFQKLLNTIGNIVPHLLGTSRLEFFRNAIFGLCDVELAHSFTQHDLANAQVRPSHVQC
jgi:hypothetical protein